MAISGLFFLSLHKIYYAIQTMKIGEEAISDI